jgi:hypothetical protein
MLRTFTCDNGCCKVELLANINSKEYHYDTSQNAEHPERCSKAGVFIIDPEKNSILLVQSLRQLWGVPKGNLHNLETSADCATREVKEETGLTILKTDFSRAVKINRALYYYVEKSEVPVSIQYNVNNEENDAVGITWIKIDCLKKYVENGNMELSSHCRILFRKFLGIVFPITEFKKVKKK